MSPIWLTGNVDMSQLMVLHMQLSGTVHVQEHCSDYCFHYYHITMIYHTNQMTDVKQKCLNNKFTFFHCILIHIFRQEKMTPRSYGKDKFCQGNYKLVESFHFLSAVGPIFKFLYFLSHLFAPGPSKRGFMFAVECKNEMFSPQFNPLNFNQRVLALVPA